MRRLPLYTTLALAGALLAACGGSDSKADPTTTRAAVSATASAVASTTTQASPTAATPAASATSAPSATATTEAATPTPAAATATNPPAGNTPVATQPPPPPPTATPQSSGNPQSASIGVGEVGTSRWIPAAVSVAVGGSVSWSWSGTSQFHNVSGLDFALSSDPGKAGSYSHTFSAPGVYHFTCDVHPDTMKGTVTVQ